MGVEDLQREGPDFLVLCSDPSSPANIITKPQSPMAKATLPKKLDMKGSLQTA